VGSRESGDQLPETRNPICRSDTIFDDDALLTIADEHPDEERFVALGMGSLGRILVVL
jgi:hypothetical protein